MDAKMLARLGAVVFVAVAITATAIELTRTDKTPADRSAGQTQSASADPLRDELIRCQRLGEGGPHDAACLRAWAENRERFLAPGARPAERMPQASGSESMADDHVRKELSPAPAAPQPEAR